MCFRVLDHFDKRMGYKNNRDVFVSMLSASHKRHLRFGINWQSRLQGFLLEWLTDLYYRQKFGVDKCLKIESDFIKLNNNNMIPRIIHYCWFGDGEKTRELECIESWKKHCPDWQFVEWNETNFNVNDFEYTKNAYRERCWTKVANFVRFWALYNYGGIYLDTDVMVLNRLTDLLKNECFFGLEYNKKYPFYENDFKATLFGTAIIGCVEKHETIGRILEHYKTKEFNYFERTEESNSDILITNLFKDDILNNCTVYGINVLYPNIETNISYTKHLKFDSWKKDRI
jgi:mannosyltransferase OCH1-like enzyme